MPDQKWSWAITFITWIITFSICCFFGNFLGLHVCWSKKKVCPTLAKGERAKIKRKEKLHPYDKDEWQRKFSGVVRERCRNRREGKRCLQGTQSQTATSSSHLCQRLRRFTPSGLPTCHHRLWCAESFVGEGQTKQNPIHLGMLLISDDF